MINILFIVIVLLFLYILVNPVVGILLLIVAITGLVAYASYANSETQKILDENTKHYKEALNDFTYDISRTVGIYTFLINSVDKILVIKYDGKTRVEKPTVLNIDEITNIEILQNDMVVKEKSINRAIVGGLIAGGVGAVVGSCTAKSSMQANSIKLKLKLKDINKPMINFKIFDISSNLKEGMTSTSEYVYDEAEKILTALEIVGETIK